MDAPSGRTRSSLALWIAIVLVAVGAVVIVISLAPGQPRLEMFIAAGILIAVGMVLLARIARARASRDGEPTSFWRALRRWIWTTVVGVACFAVGVVVLETFVLPALVGLALVLLGALGAIITAVRHRS